MAEAAEVNVQSDRAPEKSLKRQQSPAAPCVIEAARTVDALGALGDADSRAQNAGATRAGRARQDAGAHQQSDGHDGAQHDGVRRDRAHVLNPTAACFPASRAFSQACFFRGCSAAWLSILAGIGGLPPCVSCGVGTPHSLEREKDV